MAHAAARPSSSARPPLAGAVVLLLVVVLAVVDPTGLLAPVGGHGMPVIRFGGVYQWAPLLVGLPVLLAGTMLPVYALARSGRALFAFTWVAWSARSPSPRPRPGSPRRCRWSGRT